MGGKWSVWNGTWSLLFPDEWAGKQWPRAYMCPRQKPHDPGAPEYQNGSFELPLYWITDVVGYDAATLRKDSRTHDVAAAPNRLSSVRFPSQKAHLWEALAFCPPGASEPGWLEGQGSAVVPTSVLLFDGSATRLVRNDQLPGIELTMPYCLTIDGVHGRDIR